MDYMGCAIKDIVKIIPKEDVEWVATLRIPYNSTNGEWVKKHAIDALILEAIDSGKLTPIKYSASYKAAPNIMTDYIAGAGGALRSQADGKMYDSKSAYRKSLKAHGMVEMGNDAPTKGRDEIRGDFDCSKELKQALEQHLG